MSERAQKRMAESRQYMAEIVGEEGLQGQRMQAGAILDLMDVLAGRVAATHAGCRVVTLSFDRLELTRPILHQDLVRLEGRPVHVGRSSIMVAVDVYRQDFLTRAFSPIQRSFVTMVAIDEAGRPNRAIPGLRLESEEERTENAEALRHRDLGLEWDEQAEQLRGGADLAPEAIEEPFNREKREYLTPEETTVRVRRMFMPRHSNVLGTVFGGDILLWMDRVATHTARQFTRNRHMITLAMSRILFRQPIYASDMVEMTARVVYVRRYTVEMEIEVVLQREDGTEVPSHSGVFTVLNYDESGFKRPIITGLRLEADDQPALRRYLLARRRHEFWTRQRAESGAAPEG